MLITSILWASNVWGKSLLFVVAVYFEITYGLSIALLPSVIADCFGSKEIFQNYRCNLYVISARGLARADRGRIVARSIWKLRSCPGFVHRPVGISGDCFCPGIKTRY